MTAVDTAESLQVLDRIARERCAQPEADDLLAYRRHALDPANPAFEHCTAQGFASETAHVVASVDERLGRTGFLGFFEASEGADMEPLLAEATEWLRARGRRIAIAPFDLTVLHRYRFGVGSAAGFVGEPSNPARYVDAFGSVGFSEAGRYATGLRCPPTPPRFVREALELPPGVRVRQLDPTRFRDELLLLHDLSVRAFSGSSDVFVPFDADEFLYWYLPMEGRVDHRYIDVLELGPDPIGFCFSFVDRGRLVVKTLAITPEHRGVRLSAALIESLHTMANQDGLACVLYALVREGNEVWHMRDADVDIVGRYITMARTC